MATNDNIRHGIDDYPGGDAEKGTALGGLGGVTVGAVAGSVVGPIGTIVGAVAGGLLGAGVSGAAVRAVDQVDSDNTITGVGDGATRDVNEPKQADEAQVEVPGEREGVYPTGLKLTEAGAKHIAQVTEALQWAEFAIILSNIELLSKESNLAQEATQILSQKNDVALGELEASIGGR